MTPNAPSRPFDLPLYGWWAAANGVSELLGLGATVALGWWVAASLGEPPSALGLMGTTLVARARSGHLMTAPTSISVRA